MSKVWVENGPVALPTRSLAYVAGAIVAVLAVVGVGLGFKASLREAPIPGAQDGTAVANDGALTARPLVEIPPPVEATEDTKAADAEADAEADKAKADELTAQSAALAVQAKTAKSGGNIDEILTDKSEKPPAPVKAPAEDAPGAPVKSDVPF